jgi:hypothetical protein
MELHKKTPPTFHKKPSSSTHHAGSIAPEPVRRSPTPLQSPTPKPAKPLQERIRERHKDLDLINSIFDEDRHRDWEFDKGFRSGQKPKTTIELIPAATVAYMIDVLVTIMTSGFFIIAFAMIVGSPVRHLFDPIFDLKIPLVFFIEVYFGVYWLYAVTSRLMVGATFGETYCNLKLGTPTQRWSATYGLRVALRETLILATGVVLLPLWIFWRESDFMGSRLALEYFSTEKNNR